MNIIEKIKNRGGYFAMMQGVIMTRHSLIAHGCRKEIKRLLAGDIPSISLTPKVNLTDRKVIWLYWGQGWQDENLPDVVRFCSRSVDKYRGSCEVVRLSDDNLSDYLDLPPYIYEKLSRNDGFTRTFFSDLLRMALLHTYGGVWLDATVLLTRPLPAEYLAMDFFAYQRSDDEPNPDYWRGSYYPYYCWHPKFRVRLLSSIIFSKERNPLIGALLSLLCNYWKEQEGVKEYFYMHICFHELVSGIYRTANCPITNDCPPHIVQTYLTGGTYPYMSMEDALQTYPIHKLTYKGVDAERLDALKRLLLNLTDEHHT